MSDILSSEADLRRHYPAPAEGAVVKQLDHIDPHCGSFIERSPLVCIGTAREGALPDVSPRGGEPGFVQIADRKTLLLPDWPGNNRLDSLTNIVASGGIGLLFFVPGFNDLLRVNGRAEVSVAEDLRTRFVMRGNHPRSVMVVHVEEAYLHCTKALVRSRFWDEEQHQDRSSLPSAGAMYRDQLALDTVPAEVIDGALDRSEKDDLY